MNIKTTTNDKARAVYISSDIEGCSTLVHWDEVRPGDGAEYQRARRILVEEINAAIEGAFSAGATSACVNDAHSSMRNIIGGGLDARARVVSGRGKPHYMLEGIEHQKNAVAFFIAYHGAIGDSEAVMGHTYSPRVIWECRLAGHAVGELTINAALAGYYGVPVALVSGDRTTLLEAKRNIPWAKRVETKNSISYYAAECKSPAQVKQELKEAAAEAIQGTNLRPFVLRPPIRLEIETMRTSQADAIQSLNGFTRPGPRTVAYVSDDMFEVYRALTALIAVGQAAEA